VFISNRKLLLVLWVKVIVCVSEKEHCVIMNKRKEIQKVKTNKTYQIKDSDNKRDDLNTKVYFLRLRQ